MKCVDVMGNLVTAITCTVRCISSNEASSSVLFECELMLWCHISQKETVNLLKISLEYLY